MAPKQKEKAKACTNADELITLIQEEGIELSDEQLEKVAGGDFDWSEAVPKMQYA